MQDRVEPVLPRGCIRLTQQPVTPRVAHVTALRGIHGFHGQHIANQRTALA